MEVSILLLLRDYIKIIKEKVLVFYLIIFIGLLVSTYLIFNRLVVYEGNGSLIVKGFNEDQIEEMTENFLYQSQMGNQYEALTLDVTTVFNKKETDNFITINIEHEDSLTVLKIFQDYKSSLENNEYTKTVREIENKILEKQIKQIEKELELYQPEKFFDKQIYKEGFLSGISDTYKTKEYLNSKLIELEKELAMNRSIYIFNPIRVYQRSQLSKTIGSILLTLVLGSIIYFTFILFIHIKRGLNDVIDD